MTPSALLSEIRSGHAAADKMDTGITALWAEFSMAVRRTRKERGFTIAEFASHMGISAAYCSMLEIGTRDWDMEKAELAVRILRRGVEWPDCPHKR